MLTIRISLILLIAVAGCNIEPAMKSNFPNTESINPRQLPVSDKLSKDIVVFIGRGGCCYGHVIWINREGNLNYWVGTYHLSDTMTGKSSGVLPEILELNSIDVDQKYKKKQQVISIEKMKELLPLVESEERLRFEDKGLVFDDYVYQVYFDNKRIAYGYSSHLDRFPLELRELIKLVVGLVELHKLPGMA